MTKLRDVSPHPLRRTLLRAPKAFHLLWIMALGLLLLGVLIFWSHSVAAAPSASCDPSFIQRHAAGAGGTR